MQSKNNRKGLIKKLKILKKTLFIRLLKGIYFNSMMKVDNLMFHR